MYKNIECPECRAKISLLNEDNSPGMRVYPLDMAGGPLPSGSTSGLLGYANYPAPDTPPDFTMLEYRLSHMDNRILNIAKELEQAKSIMPPEDSDVHNINRRIDLLAQKVASVESRINGQNTSDESRGWVWFMIGVIVGAIGSLTYTIPFF